ncbi:Glycosyltransferase involved in cell wall bisynthesis [Geopseudomonas sagittaria]|uniref:Glycosyltransferase involved in cell wall bisynthesis n=1 Tax=Geopseudomonas sagittaria TaxID=1135990 RepID=A0A1I5T1J8_9GAMM|nr:glycosyltransferase [Pseudomonas sagittaria]SFP76527.1 Glycosyltransferase involved in cell wall bisynthesis [Pseudomonas sagittaria]
MRILLAHKYHYLKGGAEVFYFEVANVLKKHGHCVAFFSTMNSENVDTGDPLFEVEGPSYAEGNIFSRVIGSRDIFHSKKNKQAMLDAIDDFKPDLIHAFAIHVHLTPSILEAAKERNIPVVMSCNDYKHICPNYKIYDGSAVCEACKGGKFYQAAVKKCCKGSLIYSTASAIEAYVHERHKVYDRLVDKYLFASDFMLRKTQDFWRDKKINYGVLKNPFDASEYEVHLRGDYALYFGRVIEEKGVDRIIAAAELIPIPLKIVGDGPDLEKLKRVVTDKNLVNVEFLGAVWGAELKEVLYGARFVIVPSLWHENFPYVVFQSFAAGKPVVGSRRGGIPELVSGDRGILFDPDNIAELASCMEALWRSPEKSAEMGRLARDYVESEFSSDVFYSSLMSSYLSVMR